MKKGLLLLLFNTVSLSCFGLAVFVMLRGAEGWGWLLFIGFMSIQSYNSVSEEEKDKIRKHDIEMSNKKIEILNKKQAHEIQMREIETRGTYWEING